MSRLRLSIVLAPAVPGAKSVRAAHQAIRNDEPWPGCQPGEAAALLVNLFDAFNRGDEVQLARVFGPNFHWYSVTEGARARAGTTSWRSTRTKHGRTSGG